MGVDMHPYCCYVHVVILWYIIHQNHGLAWQLTWLDAYWKGEVLSSNLCRESKSLIRDLGLSAQEGTDTTLISCFFLLTFFFAPCNSPRLCTGTSSSAPEKGPDILSDIDYDIGGYHTQISGHPILVPDIDRFDTDIGISCHRYRVLGHPILYPILIPISGMWFTISVTWWPISGVYPI